MTIRLTASCFTLFHGHSKDWQHYNNYSHGPHIELYLAEEAIGLVRSLDWEVSKGPLWKNEEEQEADNQKKQNYFDLGDNGRYLTSPEAFYRWE